MCHNKSSFSLFDYYLIIWLLWKGRHLLTNSSFSLFDYYGKEGICSTELHVPGLEANRLTVTENLFPFLEYLVVVFIFSVFSFNFFYDHFFICPHFSSKCYLIGLSTESWNIMTLKVVKATVLMVRSFNENWPTKISTMTMKWKLSDKASQWNLQLVSTVPICINETFNWYPLFLYVILEINFFPQEVVMAQ